MIRLGTFAPIFFLANLSLAHAHSASVSVAGCFGDFTFTSPPESIVSLDPQATAIISALGLADRLVAVAPTDGAPPQLAEARKDRLVILTEQDRKSREAILALEPDLLIASDPALFTPQALGEGASWQKEDDVGVYISDASCPAFYGEVGPQTFEPLLKDIKILGDIFHIKEAATKLMRDSLKRLKAVQKAAAGQGRKAVLLAGSKGNELTLREPCCNGAKIMFELVGLEAVQDRLSNGWDALAKTDPEVIILTEEANASAQEKRAALLADPEMAQLAAVRKGQIILLHQSDLSLGLGFVEGAENLNRQLSTLE